MEGVGHLSERLRKSGIRMGAPMQFPDSPEVGFIRLSRYPYVFYATDLTLVSGPADAASQRETLHNVMVMMGHGIVLGPKEHEWQFLGTRQPVSETVRQFDEVAHVVGWPGIDVIISCHDETQIAHITRVSFSHGNRPHIYPRTTAYLAAEAEIPSMTRGVGARLTARAEAWSGIAWWRNFWAAQPNRALKQRLQVPHWAVMGVR